MATCLDCVGVATIVYSAGTATIRYLYVRSSFETNIDRVLKRDYFIYKSVVVGELLNLLTLISHYIQPTSPDYGLSPLVIYQACTSPKSYYTLPPYTVFPLMMMIILGTTSTNLTCNFCLFRYLQSKTQNTIARSEVDKKKDRKRNLVPAQIGLIIIAFGGTYIIIIMITYMVPLKFLDSGTRAFINATYADLSHCIISPIIIISGSKEVSRKILKVFNSLLENIKGKLFPDSRIKFLKIQAEC